MRSTSQPDATAPLDDRANRSLSGDSPLKQPKSTPSRRHAVALAMAALTTHAWAQTEPQRVEITGAKPSDFGARSGIPLAQVPQSVQVIDEEDIVARGASSVEDVLRAVPSATVAGSRVGSGASGTLRLRGFAAYEMRNGIRQRYYQDVDSSALSNIARIEVLKGPSGVLFGQSGVGGIVSIITKQPTEEFAGSAAR